MCMNFVVTFVNKSSLFTFIPLFLGSSSSWIQNIKDNQRIKNSGQTFTCECGKFYSHQASLYNHKTYHCGKPPQFSCPYCPMKTHRKGNLKTHLIIRHQEYLKEMDINTNEVSAKIPNSFTVL